MALVESMHQPIAIRESGLDGKNTAVIEGNDLANISNQCTESLLVENGLALLQQRYRKRAIVAAKEK